MGGIKRKILVILAAAIVMTCFNGCGGNDGENSEETANTAQITETVPEILETVATESAKTEMVCSIILNTI